MQIRKTKLAAATTLDALIEDEASSTFEKRSPRISGGEHHQPPPGTMQKH
jgi:hypothetical protein